MLLELGMTRKQVAEVMGISYGFVQNVYASVYGVSNPRRVVEDNFLFTRTFGVEMEIIHSNKRKIVTALRRIGILCVIEDYNHITKRHWKIVSDASVVGGFEVVSPVLKGEDGLSELKKVCDTLLEVGAKIKKCCGLHVHMGTDDFNSDIKVWKNLYRNYARLESTIDSFMPPSRRNNRYCQSMKVPNWTVKVNAAVSLESLERLVTDRSRFFKLNSQSYWRHHTVEFRQHSGSVEFEKVKNWILFCARFVEFSKKNRIVRENKNELKKFLNNDLINYYNNRAARFAA